jgi:hypothetical protein
VLLPATKESTAEERWKELVYKHIFGEEKCLYLNYISFSKKKP